jgi:hypothetical protein
MPLRLLGLAALVALCIAAPAGAAGQRVTPFTGAPFAVEASGTVLSHGASGTLGHFRIDPAAEHVVVFRKHGVTFRSLAIRSVAFLRNAVRITGIGMVNGSRIVHFTSVAVAHPRGTADRFGLIYDHGARLGGALRSGHVSITPLSTSTKTKGLVAA